ncbi:acyltransferase family protein [Thiopseudomonas alkaliphila]|uniref:acyltransferase family protein n=1 Tax=Thiopseudomonas alkaliphila TaxID=1697053 RepID=UPI0006A2D142|nr:acyltransferase family protein [Thiopseudomonas alkaliphila]AKX50712.1 hypothetical protein AKN92_03795 [Thiopseudomonas alkaliphila]AKX57047.1 hypothetical protein AKN89_03815 [Thiopseudomonas alkaliphila]
MQSNFRYDINGLRALAVLAVVLFHFHVPGFSGGFVGVDIFFVISGFLMTGIIVRGLSSEQGFRLFDFYIARARRIIPALLTLCIILLTAGWLLLAPDDYVKLAREVDRALLFISNDYYYKHSGYFDTDSHERLLLHTWSLSVEWQFYIIYPLIISYFARLSYKYLPCFIGAMLLVSFAYSIKQSTQEANYAFYLLPSRAWEMLAGGLVFYWVRGGFWGKQSPYIYVLGLALIATSIVIYDADTVWPGTLAVLPVLGTSLVIVSAYTHWSNSNFVAQRLGDWSYSVYLWHWPLAVILVLLGIAEFSAWSLVLIAASIFLGWASYRLIENPLRKLLTGLANWKVLLLILLAIMTVLMSAEKIRKEKGYLNRISAEVHEILSAEFDRYSEMDKCHAKRAKGGPECVYGDGDDSSAIMLGDSHAMSLMPLLTDYLQQKNGRLLDWTESACPTLEGISFLDSAGSKCEGVFETILLRLEQYKNTPVFISNRYSASLVGANEKNAPKKPEFYIENQYSKYSDKYTEEVYRTYKSSICKIAENNPVYVFSPIPELKLHVPRTMGRALMYRDERIRVSVSRNEFETRNLWADQLLSELQTDCGVKVIDLTSAFCDTENCYGDRDGKPMYFDDDHLNTYGALLLKDILEAELAK